MTEFLIMFLILLALSAVSVCLAFYVAIKLGMLLGVEWRWPWDRA